MASCVSRVVACCVLCAVQAISDLPERLTALLQLTGDCLGAAVKHGCELMLPLFSLYLPSAWQLITDCLASSHRLLSACKACNSDNKGVAGINTAASGQQQQGLAGQGTKRSSDSSSSSYHLGPHFVGVLQAVLQALPTCWQCYQALLQQRLEQRRLYMASLDADDSSADHLALGSQSSPSLGFGSQSQRMSWGGGGAATNNAAEAFLRAELQREMKWMVNLLQLGGEIVNASSSVRSSGIGGSGTHGCSQCVAQAVVDQQLQEVWKAALQGVLKVTATPLAKVRGRRPYFSTSAARACSNSQHGLVT